MALAGDARIRRPLPPLHRLEQAVDLVASEIVRERGQPAAARGALEQLAVLQSGGFGLELEADDRLEAGDRPDEDRCARESR